jgi:phage gp29-like protein
VAQEHISERFSIPLMQDGQTPLKAKAAPPPSLHGGQPPAPPAQCNEPPAQEGLKLVLKGAVPDVGQPASTVNPLADPTGTPVIAQLTQRVAQAAGLASWVHSLEELLAQCGSLEEFQGKLLDAFAGMNPADVAEGMQQALAVAELSGRFDGREG